MLLALFSIFPVEVEVCNNVVWQQVKFSSSSYLDKINMYFAAECGVDISCLSGKYMCEIERFFFFSPVIKIMSVL